MIERESNTTIGLINGVPIKTKDLGVEGSEYFRYDPIVNTALLLTLTGYLQQDGVVVNGSEYYPLGELKLFLNYMLNDERAAPRKFDLRVDFSNLDQIPDHAMENDHECIVSFSGGIDSTAGILYAIDQGYKVKPVWIGFGQKNEADELAVVQNICGILDLEPTIIKFDMKEYVDKGWTEWKYGIIPGRNFLFAAVAASMASLSNVEGNDIYICAHKEEINPVNTDKSRRFFDTCTSIFSVGHDKDIKLTTPFFEATKPEMIFRWVTKWAADYGISPEDTVSCYHGNKCGGCKACINRAVSFACCGLQTEEYIKNPFVDEDRIIQDGYLNRWDTLQLERRLDFLYALDFNRDVLPDSISDFIDVELPKYPDKMVQRQDEIRAGLNIK